ncbi:MerR family transcriptional regulator [Nocardioides sp. cx-169]|uniref:MerR family transcriptional regulator n=1 Tax=Nocardioides sp. cx-169 TaxID=2899080 RepID=UPI001E30E634|nr:MerR family transcriptional regulator [Nocardioides sp. cx-169]MCD4534938.1 MerR family transcriptional regulator [Nocardioides sp. cx-169]
MDLLTIGDFGRAAGLSAKALRLYDELGLLRPAEVDRSSGYRLYAPAQLDRARLVARLRLVGMPLARIREVCEADPAERAGLVAAYWSQVDADHASRRGVVATLVLELETKEHAMTPTHHLHAHAAVRHGRGARDAQLDVVHAGSRVFAVADGFGASPAAAEAAVAAMTDLDAAPDGSPGTVLRERLARAFAAVADVAGDQDGTTLTALWLVGGQVHLGHVGDARGHRVRDGAVRALTRDHTSVQALVEEGRLTPDEARVHEHRALLNRALAPGTPADADVTRTDVRAGDRLVLTTDGVHAVLGPDLDALLSRDEDAETVAAAVAAAVEDAGAPDNYSVVVVDLAS